jgi:membrane associated rhomboid family serine protease
VRRPAPPRPKLPSIPDRSIERPRQDPPKVEDKVVLAEMTREGLKTAWFTFGIIGCLGVVYGVQMLIGFERSIALASVEPTAIREGEWIRLLTGTYLHGGHYHIVGNVMAMRAYGAILESKVPRARIALVYLLSCLGGSVASVMTPPEVQSVGASGGIVGVLGYLFIHVRRQPKVFPPAFKRITASIFTGLIVSGALGFWFIDNAGHAGGALTGMFIALLTVDAAETTPPELDQPLFDLLGLIAGAVILLGTVATVAILLGAVRAGAF